MKLGTIMIDIMHIVVVLLHCKANNPSLGIAGAPQRCKGVSPFPLPPSTTNTYAHLHNHNRTASTEQSLANQHSTSKRKEQQTWTDFASSSRGSTLSYGASSSTARCVTWTHRWDTETGVRRHYAYLLQKDHGLNNS